MTAGLPLRSRRSPDGLVLLALLAAALLLLCSTAHAGQSSDSHWLIAPYLWGPSLKGSADFGGTVVPLDVAVNELAGGVRAGEMGYVQWTKEKEFLYVESLGFRFIDHQFEPIHDLAIRSDLFMIETGYGRHFAVALPTGLATVSPYAGVRYVYLTATAKTPDDALIRRTMSATEEWFEPTLGVIAETPLIGPLGAALKLDLAGLGLSRDHYWNTIAVLRWHFTPHWSAGLGYRISRFKSEADSPSSLGLSLRGSGPEGGLIYSF